MLALLLATLSLAQPTVTLVSAGDEPRAPLRLAWTDGAQRYTEVTKNHVVVQLGGLLVDPAPVDTTQRIAWVATSAGDTLSVRLVGASMTTSEDREPPDLQGLVGLTGRLVVDERGRTVSHAVTPPPPPLSEELERQVHALGRRVQQVAVPLPEQPVGIGARWRIIDRLDTGPVEVGVVTTATLLARNGDELQLRISSAVDPPSGEVSVQLDGFTGKIKELAVSGTQDLTLRLDRPVALERTSHIFTHLVVRGWKGPFPVTVTMDVRQRIRATAHER